MICLEIQTDSNGGGAFFTPINPQPTDYTTCTYVLQSGNEVGVMSPLTPSQGAEIALAIGLLWAIAAVFRVLINLFRPSATDNAEHS